MHEKIKQRLKELDEERRRSITFDNGTEFARCHRLEKHLGMELYFADPGCPYQRGTNENTNGLIRQYFPKGTDFRDISHYEVRQVENLLNNRPRACLGFRTPWSATRFVVHPKWESRQLTPNVNHLHSWAVVRAARGHIPR